MESSLLVTDRQRCLVDFAGCGDYNCTTEILQID